MTIYASALRWCREDVPGGITPGGCGGWMSNRWGGSTPPGAEFDPLG